MEPKLSDIARATQAAFGKVSADISTIQTDIDRGFAARKTREAELEAKQGELQARLNEAEQQLARRGDPGAGASSSFDVRASIGTCADDLIRGLQDATSTRLVLPNLSVKKLAQFRAGTLSGADLPTVALPAVGVFHSGSVATLLGLLPSRPVKSGNSVTFVRVRYEQSSPDGLRAAKVAERAAKPESSVETEPVELPLPTWAHWIDTSKQLLADAVEMQAVLDDLLQNGLINKIDHGIYADMTTSGSYSAFSPTGSETVGDAIARIAAQIANSGGKNIIVCLNPTDALSAQLHKASTSGVYLGLPPNLASTVAAVSAIEQGKILAFAAGSGAAWAEREGINVQAGLKNDDFTKNLITLLCEARGATLVRDAAHVAWGPVTA